MNRGRFTSLVKNWCADIGGTAAAEFALIFPLLMIMLMGVQQIGTGIVVNQKAIAASQIVADLIARQSTVSETNIDNAIAAGKLALDPYSTAQMGFDIVSVQYDKNNNPQVVWRETQNMTANNDGINRTAGLGVSGDGALAVTVTYIYQPVMGGYFDTAIPMEEISVSRGRTTSVITKTN